MPSPVLNQIEETISQLSRKEQLWLIEKLAHHLREGSIKRDLPEPSTFESQLMTMSSDPEIQAELKKINQEFAITEVDGLESK
ncbi:MAG: hypothetical protein AB1797_06030 [bacterium]